MFEKLVTVRVHDYYFLAAGHDSRVADPLSKSPQKTNKATTNY
jgi:hypothetical protein